MRTRARRTLVNVSVTVASCPTCVTITHVALMHVLAIASIHARIGETVIDTVCTLVTAPVPEAVTVEFTNAVVTRRVVLTGPRRALVDICVTILASETSVAHATVLQRSIDTRSLRTTRGRCAVVHVHTRTGRIPDVVTRTYALITAKDSLQIAEFVCGSTRVHFWALVGRTNVT